MISALSADINVFIIIFFLQLTHINFILLKYFLPASQIFLLTQDLFSGVSQESQQCLKLCLHFPIKSKKSQYELYGTKVSDPMLILKLNNLLVWET